MSECIKHIGCVDKDGYGVVSGAEFGHRYNIRAHRAAWMRKNGPITDGLFVLHSCDTPSCVNAEHLFLGTHQQNMDDRRRKERHSYGEKSNSTPLTEDDVIWIRKCHDSGMMTLQDIGDIFGVGKTCIHKIAHRVTWAHIEDAWPNEPVASARL